MMTGGDRWEHAGQRLVRILADKRDAGWEHQRCGNHDPSLVLGKDDALHTQAREGKRGRARGREGARERERGHQQTGGRAAVAGQCTAHDSAAS